MLFESLETLAENCSITAAKSVNRNTMGFKKEVFKPLRCAFTELFVIYVELYTEY
jgi:hypothetical protein